MAKDIELLKQEIQGLEFKLQKSQEVNASVELGILLKGKKQELQQCLNNPPAVVPDKQMVAQETSEKTKIMRANLAKLRFLVTDRCFKEARSLANKICDEYTDCMDENDANNFDKLLEKLGNGQDFQKKCEALEAENKTLKEKNAELAQKFKEAVNALKVIKPIAEKCEEHMDIICSIMAYMYVGNPQSLPCHELLAFFIEQEQKKTDYFNGSLEENVAGVVKSHFNECIEPFRKFIRK